MSTSPDYLICLECETPCYSFEWQDGKLTDVLCLACGNDEPDQFLTEDDLEALSGGLEKKA
jgi:hypothetical protein